MFKVWKRLKEPTLQSCIGIDNLRRLEELLPAFNEDAFSREQIYSLDGLAKIFDSFLGDQYLSKKNYRKDFFNRLSPEEMDSALLSVGVYPDSLKDFSEKVDRLDKEWGREEKAQEISKVLGISENLIVKRVEKQADFEDILISNSPYKPLKDYQFSVFFEAVSYLSNPLSRFIIQMPTGSGKTRTAIEIITYFMGIERKAKTSVLWLAHSEELCDQAFNAFVDTWSHVSTKPLRAVRFWGNRKLAYEKNCNNFIVSSFQKLHSQLKKDDVLTEHLKNNISLIIIDEAHKVMAPTYEEVTRAFISDDTKVIGLTATPGRSAVNEEANIALADFFFNEKINIKTSKGESAIDFLRKKKVLSHVEYFPIKTKGEYILSEAQKKHLERFLDLPPGFIEKLGEDDLRNVEIIKRLQSESQSGSRILFFACSVEHSKFISALLGCLDIKSLHVDGSTPKPQRASAINKFKDGEITVLCNYGVLSTGFDAPQTDVVFISRPTSSIVLYSQMIGRGLRGPEIGGTPKCKIIDVIDNIKGFSNENKVYDYFEDYYELNHE